MKRGFGGCGNMPTFYEFSTANQSEVRMDSANNKQQRNPVILIAGIVADGALSDAQ
jgi:hypothetical protein